LEEVGRREKRVLAVVGVEGAAGAADGGAEDFVLGVSVGEVAVATVGIVGTGGRLAPGALGGIAPSGKCECTLLLPPVYSPSSLSSSSGKEIVLEIGLAP